MTLGAIANKSEGVVLEVVLELSQGPVTALVDDLLVASEFQSLQTTDSLKTTEKKARSGKLRCSGATWIAT